MHSACTLDDAQSISTVVRGILSGGLRATYQGAGATLLRYVLLCVGGTGIHFLSQGLVFVHRDVPFSIVYFPLFSNAKLFMVTGPYALPL